MKGLGRVNLPGQEQGPQKSDDKLQTLADFSMGKDTLGAGKEVQRRKGLLVRCYKR